MTENLETVSTRSSAQEASRKMRDNNVSSLVIIDENNNKPTGICIYNEALVSRP